MPWGVVAAVVIGGIEANQQKQAAKGAANAQKEAAKSAQEESARQFDET